MRFPCLGLNSSIDSISPRFPKSMISLFFFDRDLQLALWLSCIGFASHEGDQGSIPSAADIFFLSSCLLLILVNVVAFFFLEKNL